MHGEDGLGNAGIVVSRLHHQHPSEKLICDEVRAAPNRVSLLCMGPLTNVARAFQRDPDLPALMDRIVMMGGCVEGRAMSRRPPSSTSISTRIARAPSSVRRSPRSLVPLDVTRAIHLTMSFLDELPDESTRVGAFLRKILHFRYLAYHQQLGQESIHLHDAVALLAVLQPDHFRFREMAGDVETRGELTVGATVFDRRRNRAVATQHGGRNEGRRRCDRT